jgi:hypothetical protein
MNIAAGQVRIAMVQIQVQVWVDIYSKGTTIVDIYGTGASR